MSAPQVVNDSLFRDDLIGTIRLHVIAGTQAEPDFNVEELADALLEQMIHRLVVIAMETDGEHPTGVRVRREIRQMRWGR